MESRKGFFRGSNDVKKKPRPRGLSPWILFIQLLINVMWYAGRVADKPWWVHLGGRSKRVQRLKDQGFCCSRLIVFLVWNMPGVVVVVALNVQGNVCHLTIFSPPTNGQQSKCLIPGSNKIGGVRADKATHIWVAGDFSPPKMTLWWEIHFSRRTGSNEVKIVLTSMYLRSMDGIFTYLYLRNQRNVY